MRSPSASFSAPGSAPPRTALRSLPLHIPHFPWLLRLGGHLEVSAPARPLQPFLAPERCDTPALFLVSVLRAGSGLRDSGRPACSGCCRDWVPRRRLRLCAPARSLPPSLSPPSPLRSQPFGLRTADASRSPRAPLLPPCPSDPPVSGTPAAAAAARSLAARQGASPSWRL